MSSDPTSPKPLPPKPLPSAEEINAYVEASAARTKKRLTLAPGNARPKGELVKVDRKLAIGGSSSNEPEATPTAEPAWRPFAGDDHARPKK